MFNSKDAKIIGAKEVLDLVGFRFKYLKQLLSFHGKTMTVVYIERDINGIISSFMKLGLFPAGKRKVTASNLKSFAKQYIEVINDASRRLQEYKTHFLTYEDLLIDPRRELAKIFGFLDVDSSDDVLSYIIHTPSKGIRDDYEGIKKSPAHSWKYMLKKRQITWIDKTCKARIKSRL